MIVFMKTLFRTAWGRCVGKGGWLLVLFLLGSQVSWGHEIRPAIATLQVQPTGEYSITISLNLEALLSGIGSSHEDTDDSPNANQYNQLRELPPDALRGEFDAFTPRFLEGVSLQFGETPGAPEVAEVRIPEVGDLAIARITEVVLTGTVPSGATDFVWQWEAAFGSSVIRVLPVSGAGEGYSAWLQEGTPSERVALEGVDPRSRAERFWEYVKIGFEHILPEGLDHILFVVGIFLLSTHWKPLLSQVTAFTVAHSITLGLSIYGLVQLPSSIVEPLIAASIVYVGVENLLTDHLQKWRPLVVFVFGLLHGLGFASVLFEIGLPRDAYLEGLLAFNLGVELGQLTVIALAFALVGAWGRGKAWYRPRVIIPGSLAVSVVGAWWLVERTLLS